MHLPRRLSRSPPTGFVGWVFVVPISSEGWGPVGSCQLSTSSCRPSLQEGDPFCLGLCPPRTLGYTRSPFGCYFHILIHPHSRCGSVLCGGASCPVSSPLKVCLHDWLIPPSSADLLLAHADTETVLDLCSRPGTHLSSISQYSPLPSNSPSGLPFRSTLRCPAIHLLGFLFDTAQWLVRPAHHWVQWLGPCISQLPHSGAPASLLAMLQGLRESLAPPISSIPSPGLLGKVVTRSPVFGCPRSPQSMVSSSSSSLVGPVILLAGGANLCASPSRGTLHRCFQPGLGRTQGPPVSSRPLASSPVFRSHLPAQSRGSLPGASTVSSLSPGTTCSSEYGQHDSDLPYYSQGGSGRTQQS